MLTDIALKNLKPEPKPYKRSDGGGLFVIVQPNGRKYWRIACRIDGKQKFLSGGSYPDVSLRDARHWREAIKAQLILGMKPTAQPRPPQTPSRSLLGRYRTTASRPSPSNGMKRACWAGRRVTPV